MLRQILPITALLLGSAFLLIAGGINGMVLPLRGAQEGFAPFALGLLGTGYAIGYISGCILSPGLVARVGHVRAFSVFCALAGCAVLISALMVHPWAWIPLRAVAGFCFAGAAMVVESWLSERAKPSSRGRIFGIYTMVNLAASTGGQMLLTLGSADDTTFFIIAAVFYALALVPTATSSSRTPKPLVKVNLDLPALWRNSPIAVFGVLMVGISNATFGTLSVVYAVQIGLPTATVPLFASIGILAGAAIQIPVGYLSDRNDRRRVLIGIAFLALVAEAVFLVLFPTSVPFNLGLAALFGLSVYSMYPVIVSHANDHAEPGTAIQISGGLLLVYGIGAIIGPLAAGVAIGAIGPKGLFITTAGAHVMLVAFALWRIRQREAVETDTRSVVQAAPMARSSTPQTVAFAAEAAGTTAVQSTDPEHEPDMALK